MIILSDELLSTFWQKYGEDDQLRQTMGECGELIAVCQNYYRAKKFSHRTECLNDVFKEAADVFFMIQQIRSLDPELFDQLCKIKLKKVMKKLANENN